ncbi:MAG: hypothetical protein JNN20_11630 [Betaproteobacteria bacterium]|nr:hypothetical protein [Betaproteobacteria bacterium]
MFGIFAKPNLNLAERAALMLTIVQASLMGYLKHHEWLSEELRATVIDNWLKRNDRKAGIAFRIKISAAADELARYLVVTQGPEEIRELYGFLERSQHSKPGESSEVDASVHFLLSECERLLIAKALAS